MGQSWLIGFLAPVGFQHEGHALPLGHNRLARKAEPAASWRMATAKGVRALRLKREAIQPTGGGAECLKRVAETAHGPTAR